MRHIRIGRTPLLIALVLAISLLGTSGSALAAAPQAKSVQGVWGFVLVVPHHGQVRAAAELVQVGASIGGIFVIGQQSAPVSGSVQGQNIVLYIQNSIVFLGMVNHGYNKMVGQFETSGNIQGDWAAVKAK